MFLSLLPIIENINANALQNLDFNTVYQPTGFIIFIILSFFATALPF